LRQASAVQQACTEVYGPPRGEHGHFVASLSELPGVIGARACARENMERPG